MSTEGQIAEGTKVCSVCKIEKPLSEYYKYSKPADGHEYRCRKCHGAQKKRWRERNPEKAAEGHRRGADARKRRSRERHPEKAKARSQVAEAVRTGRIVKPEACEECGEKTEKAKLHGHHRDYSKPLEVDWVCRPCHEAIHREEAEKAEATNA